MSGQLKNIIKKGNIKWQRHAIERMLERGIASKDVKDVLLNGEQLEEYPDDNPFPSGLFYGFVSGKHHYM